MVFVLTAWLLTAPGHAQEAPVSPEDGGTEDVVQATPVEGEAGTALDGGDEPGPAGAAAAGGLTVGVSKTNDANSDGQFNKFEEVPPAFSGTVTFRVTIRNTSAVPVQIIGLTDESPPGSPAVSQCPHLIGRTLTPGEAVVCEFTQFVTPVPPGSTKLDVFRAKVGRGTTPPAAGGGGPGLPCTDPDPTKCIPPCPDPPITPLPPALAGCSPASETGEGMDDSGIRFRPFQFPMIVRVDLQKTNDANGDMTFTDVETAPSAGMSVSFRIVITNLTPADLVITSLTDEVPGQPPFAICAHLVGPSIALGASVSCTYSVANYAPPAGGSLTNTVRVGVMALAPCVETPFPFPQTCFAGASDPSTVTVDPLPPAPAVLVEKTNDADGDGSFTDSETAPAAGADTTFRVVVTNPSPVPVTITSLTDELPGQPGIPVCAELIGTILPPLGSSAPCTFTLAAFSPPAGTSTVNTVRVVVTEMCPGAACRTATGFDPSTVTTAEASTPLPPSPPAPPLPPPPAPPGTAPPTPPRQGPLPRAGGSVADVAGIGALLMGLGGLLQVASRFRVPSRHSTPPGRPPASGKTS